MPRLLSRRNVLGTGAAGIAALAGSSSARAQTPLYLPQIASPSLENVVNYPASLDAAYLFLQRMMDAYAQGATLRLSQSYSDQQGLNSTAFTYDNAVAIHAFLLRGFPEDLQRATVLGNSLVYAQNTDSINDGRLRQAYFVNAPDAHGAYVLPAGAPFYFFGSSTGDLAWAGMALSQLYRRTGTATHLAAAVKLGNWIYNNTFDTRGAGGYNGGVDAGNARITYKSTEHNIDTYALFTMLAALTGNAVWTTRAAHVLPFLAAMWNAPGGFFWTGTGNDGVTINTSNIPEDVQTWSYLALQNKTYAVSLDWVKTNLATTDTPLTINSKLTGVIRISGETFASASLQALTPSASYDQPPDPNAVWLEGTAHTAAALLARHLPSTDDIAGFTGDINTAFALLSNILLAQLKLGLNQTVGGTPIVPGQGIVASSSVCNTGFGSSYYPNLHIGATGWYVLAGLLGDPFKLGYRL